MTANRPLEVFAPGSLAPVRAALSDGFAAQSPGTTVRFCPPAYSGLLAGRIRDGAAADVFISANRHYVADLHQAGLIPSPVLLAGNSLSLIVRAGLAGSVRTVAAALRPGPRLLVPPAATDPLGAYVVAMLAEAGLLAALEAKRDRGEVAEKLADAAAMFAAGELDAAFIYHTSVSAFAPTARDVPLPEPLTWSAHIRFAAGAVFRDDHPHPAANPFIQYLLSPAGQTILTGAGFLPLANRGTWPLAGAV